MLFEYFIGKLFNHLMETSGSQTAGRITSNKSIDRLSDKEEKQKTKMNSIKFLKHHTHAHS